VDIASVTDRPIFDLSSSWWTRHLFICLPLTFPGATVSRLRPLTIA